MAIIKFTTKSKFNDVTIRYCVVFLSLLLSCAGINNNANALEPQPQLVSESEFFTDIPSVETVTRLPQPRSETPAAVTIIDRDMIRANGARDLADLFRLVPGFQVAYPRGHRPTVTYHGLGDAFSRRMQILIDGRSVYGALFGNVSWSSQAVAIEDIERIEVTRGPNTASYGANAFLGTINIITRHSIQQHGTITKFAIGNNGIRDGLLSYGTGFDGGDIRLTAGYNSDLGLDNLPDENQTRFINVRSDLQINTSDSLLLQAGISRADPEEGFFNDVFIPPATSKVNANFQQIRWQRDLATDNSLSIQFYHNYRKVDYDYLTDPIDLGVPFGLTQVPVSFDDTTERYDLELQHTFNAKSDLRFVWGIGSRYDRVTAPTFFNNNEPITTQSSRLFGNTEWLIKPDLIINGGAMLEHTNFTGTDFSPRLAVNYHLQPNHTVRAAWSRAKRTPSLFEEHSDLRFFVQGVLIQHQFDSAGGLKPETMNSFELGYLGQFSSINLSFDVRAYRDKISDLISEVSVPAADLLDGQAFGHRNEGDVTVDGVDMALTYRPSRNSRIVLTYARMHASASEVGSDVVATQRDRIDSVPNYSGSILAMHRIGRHWNASLGYYFVDDMRWLSDGDSVPSHERLDLRLARQFKLGNTRGELALIVQNLGDDYADFEDNQFFETRTFLTFELQF